MNTSCTSSAAAISVEAATQPVGTLRPTSSAWEGPDSATTRPLPFNGNDVTLWSFLEKEAEVLRATRENPMLKGVVLPEALKIFLCRENLFSVPLSSRLILARCCHTISPPIGICPYFRLDQPVSVGRSLVHCGRQARDGGGLIPAWVI